MSNWDEEEVNLDHEVVEELMNLLISDGYSDEDINRLVSYFSVDENRQNFEDNESWQAMMANFLDIAPRPPGAPLQWVQVEEPLLRKHRGKYRCDICGGPKKNDGCKIKVPKRWLVALDEDLLNALVQKYPNLRNSVKASRVFVATAVETEVRSEEDRHAFAVIAALREENAETQCKGKKIRKCNLCGQVQVQHTCPFVRVPKTWMKGIVETRPHLFEGLPPDYLSALGFDVALSRYGYILPFVNKVYSLDLRRYYLTL